MDFGTTLKHLAPFAIPILALCIPIVYIVMRIIERMRRHQNLHQTIRHITEKGLPIPEELLKAAVSSNLDQPRTSVPSRLLRTGIINVSIGIGLMIAFNSTLFEQDGLWFIGIIPFVLGLGFLVIWRIESKKSAS